MAVHFEPLRIKFLKRETPDCVSIGFEVPEEKQSAFAYKEGQNITIKKVIDGEELRRSYSICAAPYENELKIAVKKVEGGRFSGFANEELKIGDTLEILPPTGNFTSSLCGKKQASYIAIAAGSGITPVISIIKHTLQTEPGSSFTLVFGNRSRSSIIFFDELQDIKDKFLGRFNLVNVLSRERIDTDIHFGRIDREKLTALEKFIPYASFDAAYICGPEEMIFTARDFLSEKGMDAKKIHFELFTVPGQKTKEKSTQEKQQEKETGPKSRVDITLDGRSFQIEIGYNGESILDAALQHGADLPYACKGGVCSTCKARVLEGKVIMDTNYALEPEEVEQGFILTCQSHPRSEKVRVDFDAR